MTAACSQLCDPTIWDVLAYAGLVMVALGAVGLVYGVARHLARSRRIPAPLVPVAAIAAFALAGVVVVPRFPVPTFSPVAIVAGGRALAETDPTYLLGRYAVSWTATPVGATSCHLSVALFRAGTDEKVQDLVNADVSDTVGTGNSSPTPALVGGSYTLRAV